MQRNYYPQYQQPYGGIAQNGYYYPTSPQPPQQPTPQAIPFYAVNGIEGARAFIVPPSSNAYLLDSDNPYLFFKEADQSGKCTIKAFSLAEIPIEDINKTALPDTSSFATKDDIKALESSITALEQKLVNSFRATLNSPTAPSSSPKTAEIPPI